MKLDKFEFWELILFLTEQMSWKEIMENCRKGLEVQGIDVYDGEREQ